MIVKSDILDDQTFAKERPVLRQAVINLKKNRRLQVGPDVTVFFENRETLLWQIQEMLHIEKGGPDQVDDELAAYAPLVPKGNEWVATVMIEIPDASERAKKLAQLGHFEFNLVLKFAGHEVMGQPETDQERTTQDGKTSSVHFIRWTFTPDQIELLRVNNQDIILESGHENYHHKAILPETVRRSLCSDFTSRVML